MEAGYWLTSNYLLSSKGERGTGLLKRVTRLSQSGLSEVTR